MAGAEFTHLHVASWYSLRYGTASPAALAARAASLGMPALALTDRDGLYGAFKHARACADAGIRPLLGADLAVRDGAVRDGRAVRDETAVRHGRTVRDEKAVRNEKGGHDGRAVHDERMVRSERTRGGRATALGAPGPRPGPWPGQRHGQRHGQPERVTLLAAGRQGWASLCRLVTAAHTAPGAHAAPGEGRGPGEGGGGVPAVTPELIAEHGAGLVVLLGPGSDVGRAVAARRPDLARRALDRWRYLAAGAAGAAGAADAAGAANVAVEIVDHLERGSTFRAARMAELARDARVPAVLSNAVRYLDPADSPAAQVLDAARGLVPLGSPRLAPHNGRAYLASQEDMAATAARVASAMSGPGPAGAAGLLLAETGELARRCMLDPVLDLGIGLRHLPDTDSGARDQHEALRARCERALRDGRYRTASPAGRATDAAGRATGATGRTTDATGRATSAAGRTPGTAGRTRAAENARDRLEHELGIIARTGMAAYFLTVADVTDRIRAAGIRCAIRGSGTGSFVNHLLGISAIDPLEHGLLMERFLSPARDTLPDIDLDVESARRLEAYRIIFDAYGAERTACVSMMETYRARSAIRDVASAMSLPPDEAGAIAKAFPHIRARNIPAALTGLPELRRSGLARARLDLVFAIAGQLDGLPRHAAMHPCGVLLSDTTLLNRTAVQQSAEGFPLSHLDKDDAETAGVIKLDVLGVRTQSAMAHALAEIERTENTSVDLDAIDRDDEATYAMIGRSRTIGCFQIESPGQRELVKKLAPRDIADLIADISLFRPGPVSSDMVGPFLRTRHGQAGPRYPHGRLREILEETGGVVIFHEQVLRIIDVMTGCGLPEADLVRRHLSTEGGPERTAPWFRAQALASGFDPATVERVWPVVAAFGGFGFCKAHAAAFAIPVYQSAWLKRHHPAAFYAGVLTHHPGMYPKRVIVADARRSGIRVLPPDVNASAADWKAEAAARAVRCPLREVRGISDAETARIVSGQPYTGLRDFWNRAGASRPVTERLVLAGAFDSLYPPDPAGPGTPARPPGPTRRDLLARAGVLARRSPAARSGTAPAPGLLITETDTETKAGDGLAELVPDGQLRDLDPTERVTTELNILGLDLSQHVLDLYADLLDGLDVVRSAALTSRRDGETVLVAGARAAVQTPAVRSGQRIIFASLDDPTGLVDLAFFESVQDRCAARLFRSWLLLARGRVRRAGPGPAAVTVNAAECWDIPALEEIRAADGIDAVRAAMAAGDIGPGAHPPARRGHGARSGLAELPGRFHPPDRQAEGRDRDRQQRARPGGPEDQQPAVRLVADPVGVVVRREPRALSRGRTGVEHGAELPARGQPGPEELIGEDQAT